MTGVINVGIGNVGSLCNMLRRIGEDNKIVNTLGDLVGCTRLIFPGVGAFDNGIAHFNNSGMRDEIERLVVISGIPFLGICLGMQLLSLRSDEGVMCGLGWIEAEALHFRSNTFVSEKFKIPHMGWNNVKYTELMSDFKEDGSVARFYFVHSYYVVPKDLVHVGAVTQYGNEFTSIIRKDNIMGCQFHPEKSHRYGMEFLSRFIKLT
jgi:glutamine amidotransferase